MRPIRIAIFASGSGTNAEEIFRYFKSSSSVEIVGLLSNNLQAYALQRAKNHGVDTFTFTRSQFCDTTEVVDWLKEKHVTHIVLAGFMWLIPQNLVQAYPNKIVNIHPALLPKFGGKGMYGMHVHEAVKAAGETETGITIHLVNEKYDEGKILFQASCLVSPTDSPEEIANKVHQLEHAHYPQVIEQWVFS
jgi:phosphoribosylglycinamide formyltransferase-1